MWLSFCRLTIGGAVNSVLHVEGSSPDALTELRSWLSDEDTLRGRVKVVPPASQPGQLGSWADTLVVAVGAGGALTTLARSLTVFLGRPRATAVKVTTVAPDGTRTEVTADHVRKSDVESLLRIALHDQETAD